MGPNAMISDFWMLSFKPAFSLSSFTLIKKFFNSSKEFLKKMVHIKKKKKKKILREKLQIHKRGVLNKWNKMHSL